MLTDAHHMEQISTYRSTQKPSHFESIFFLLVHFPKQNLPDSSLNFKKSPTVYNFLMVPIMIF